MSFISFSHLIALARNSSTVFNRSGKRGHPYPVYQLLKKIFFANLMSESTSCLIGMSPNY